MSSGRGHRDQVVPVADTVTLDWTALVAMFVHPIQVAILEAMAWLDEPVSSGELRRMFADPVHHKGYAMTYHMQALAERGLIQEVTRRPIHGIEEIVYTLAPGLVERVEARARCAGHCQNESSSHDRNRRH